MVKNPVPQGKYVPAVKRNGFIFTAGMTPRKDGVLIQKGKVEAGVPLETYQKAVEQAAKNALTGGAEHASARRKDSPDHAACGLRQRGTGLYGTHGPSRLCLCLLSGKARPAGISPRAALGMASLPKEAGVEVSIVACYV